MTAALLDTIAEELGAITGRMEREARLRLDATIADLRRIDAERELRLANLERLVTDRLATIKDGAPGRNITIEDAAPVIAAEVARQVAALPPAEPGKSVTVDEVRPVLAELVAALPPAEPGKSVTVDEVAPVIAAEVARQVAALPPAEPGKSVTVDEVRPVLAELVAALPPAEPGPPGPRGPEGRLKVAKAWSDRVHYEGEVATHQGATWQAQRDTGREPPHEDWICLASAGENGRDGRSPRVRDTFDASVTDYRELDIVALGGAAFIARHDNPGPCPGPGWKQIAMQGKTGKPGDRGGLGPRGPAGPAVIALDVTDQGLLIVTNGDGSTIELDMYPLLSKLQG